MASFIAMRTGLAETPLHTDMLASIVATVVERLSHGSDNLALGLVGIISQLLVAPNAPKKDLSILDAVKKAVLK